MRWLLAMCAMLLLVPLAGAQTQVPAMGSTATQDETQSIYNILVIGDALGGGLGAGLTRITEADQSFQITNRFVEESGIARPEVYDWSETLPKILESANYDAIVVLLGSNDRQVIKAGDSRVTFGAPGWREAYKAQTGKLLDELAASGAKVYWVSLPPMADPEFETAMQSIMAVQKQEVEQRGLRFVDIRKAFQTPDGRYTDTGPDDTGAVRKLRASDGITFFKQGNNRMAQLVLAAIKEGMTEGPVESSKQEPAVAKALPAPEIELPMFGQTDADGNDVLVTPREVVTAMATASSENFQVPEGSSTDLAAIAAPGSAAEKLFRLGTAAAAPSGRVDDFSLPTPASP